MFNSSLIPVHTIFWLRLHYIVTGTAEDWSWFQPEVEYSPKYNKRSLCLSTQQLLMDLSLSSQISPESSTTAEVNERKRFLQVIGFRVLFSTTSFSRGMLEDSHRILLDRSCSNEMGPTLYYILKIIRVWSWHKIVYLFRKNLIFTCILLNIYIRDYW